MSTYHYHSTLDLTPRIIWLAKRPLFQVLLQVRGESVELDTVRIHPQPLPKVRLVGILPVKVEFHEVESEEVCIVGPN